MARTLHYGHIFAGFVLGLALAGGLIKTAEVFAAALN